ncbi:DUF2256 domain-containing protein [Mucilaginibacter gynuensis]
MKGGKATFAAKVCSDCSPPFVWRKKWEK